MKRLVLRLSFGAVLLMQSCLVCGVARAQSQANFLATDADHVSDLAPSLATMTPQFPPTDESLTAQTPLDYTSFPSLSVSDSRSLAAYSAVKVALADAIPSPAATPAFPTAKPTPKPRPYYGDNPNQWQLGLAFALVRFRSSVYSASAPGFNSSLAYWWKEWIAIEGSVTSAFAGPVFANEHFRYLGYGAGPKFSFGHGRLGPWAHVLAGGVHLIPQTASGGQNGAEFTVGGGIDYGISNVISAKAGVDYLGTHMFGEWQSSVQIVAGLSLRF